MVSLDPRLIDPRLIKGAKFLATTFAWMLASPVLSLPYFIGVCWLTSVIPDTLTSYDSVNDLFANAFMITFISIPTPLYTGPVIGLGVIVLPPLLKDYLHGFWRFLLYATLVGWLHCASNILLLHSGVMVEPYFD